LNDIGKTSFSGFSLVRGAEYVIRSKLIMEVHSYNGMSPPLDFLCSG